MTLTELPESFTLRYALDKLTRAHRYLMDTGRIWYDSNLREADALLCRARSEIRKDWFRIVGWKGKL